MSSSIADLIVEKLAPVYGFDHDFDSLLQLWWESLGNVGHPTQQQLYTFLGGEGLTVGTVADRLFDYWGSWTGSFDPSSITGLALWYKEDGPFYRNSIRTTLASLNDDPVGSWTDSSGNEVHISQAESLSRPLLKLNSQNGLPVVRFDGLVDQLFLTSRSWGAVFSMFIAVKRVSGTALAGICHADIGGGSARHFQLRYENATTVNLLCAPGVNADSETITPSQFNVVSALRAVDSNTVRVNGTGTGTAASALTPKAAMFSLGAASGTYPSTVPAAPGNIDLGEVLIYDAILSDADRDAVEGYLMTKWGVT